MARREPGGTRALGGAKEAARLNGLTHSSSGHKSTPSQAANAWLVALRERIVEVEEETEEAFRARRHLVKLLVQSITIGKRREDGSIEVRITYRFGPPSPPPAEAGGESVVPGLKNGSRS